GLRGVGGGSRSSSNLLGGLGDLIGSAARISSAVVALTALGGAAASAAADVVTLGAALAPAVGIVAAVPAAVAAAGVAMGALALATYGVADAFEAALTGSAEDFQDALEALSPAAGEVAQEVRALRPAFDGLRGVVQDA